MERGRNAQKKDLQCVAIIIKIDVNPIKCLISINLKLTELCTEIVTNSDGTGQQYLWEMS